MIILPAAGEARQRKIGYIRSIPEDFPCTCRNQREKTRWIGRYRRADAENPLV